LKAEVLQRKCDIKIEQDFKADFLLIFLWGSKIKVPFEGGQCTWGEEKREFIS
jgi:hypothetical protein